MKQAPFILSIDTSDRVLGVDVSRGGRHLKTRVIDEPRIHASMLAPTVLEVIESASLRMGDLNAVAVSKGPGSYTGLRIGVSSAKGIAYGLGLPLIGVSTMEALAVSCGTRGFRGTLVTCLSSRRNEVYVQAWDVSQSFRALSDIAAISLDEASAYLEMAQADNCAIVGSGADSLLAATASLDGWATRPLAPGIGFSTVQGVAILAGEQFEKGNFDDVRGFEPFYLKEFVAKKGGSPFIAARNR